MKLVIFDFCETLVNFQTADSFVDYVIEKEKYHQYNWVNTLEKFLIRSRALALVSKIFPELNPSKRLKLLQIRGVSKEKVNEYAESYYTEKLLPNLIPSVYALFKAHIEAQDYILIVSGGYAPYIKLFSEKHSVKGYFATEMASDSKKITGFFSGKDCLFQQKVVLLDRFLKENPIDYKSSVAYSDSKTDLPLLQWADEAFVISNKQSQAWASAFGFKEIII